MELFLIILLSIIGILSVTGLFFYYSKIKIWFKRHWKKVVTVLALGSLTTGGLILYESPPADNPVSLISRDWTTNTYYNSTSNQHSQEGHLDYINYKNENDVFNPINTSFQILDSEHFAYPYGYRAYNDRGVFDVYLKANANANFPIAYAYNKGNNLNNIHVLRSGIVGVGYYDPSTNHEYSILQTPLNSVGSIDNNTVSYNNVFTGTDLELSYHNSKFKEDLILSNTTKTLLQNNPPSSPEFGYNDATSYLVIATELDYKNIYSFNGTTNISSNFTFNKDIIFKDKYGDVLFSFINAFAYEQNNLSNVENMIMRIVHKNGHTYLLAGIKASVLNQMEFPVVLDPTTATTPPGTCTNDASVGTTAWVNPDNVKLDDNNYASCYGHLQSQYLKCTNFGFSLGDANTVDGILVTIRKHESNAYHNVYDVAVRLVDEDGTIGSHDKSSASEWSTTETAVNYGGAVDTWGDEVGTGAEVNDADFGMVISSDGAMGFHYAYIDLITITVYYSSATTPTITSTDEATSISTSGFTSGGNGVADGGATITVKGVRYGTSNPPGTNTDDGDSGEGDYSVAISGLNENDQYYFRAYATNSVGTTYCADINSASTLIGVPLESDIDVSAITSSTITLTISPDPPRDTEGSTGVWYDGVSGTGVGSSVAWESFNTESWQDTGLSENSPYVYRAKFQNRVGTDSAYSSNDVAVYTYAVAPVNGQLDVASFGDTWILWRLVDVDNNPDAGSTDGYFEIVTNPGGGSTGLSTFDDATYYYFNDTGLTADSEYGMKARYDNYNSVDTTYCDEVKQTTSSSSVIYNTTIREDGVDYFVWMGSNVSAYSMNATLTTEGCSLTDANEYIAIWNASGDWDSSWYVEDLWYQYHGNNASGNNWTVHTFDIIKIVLDDSGTELINMTSNPDIDYSITRSVSLMNNTGTTAGINFTGFTSGTSTTLNDIANTNISTLDAGEYLALWNETNYVWDLFIVGFWEPTVAVHIDDVIMTKVADTETFTIGGR